MENITLYIDNYYDTVKYFLALITKVSALESHIKVFKSKEYDQSFKNRLDEELEDIEFRFKYLCSLATKSGCVELSYAIMVFYDTTVSQLNTDHYH